MINSIKIAMWLSCLAINVLGLVVVLRAGTTPAAVYAAFVSATLALNRPRINPQSIRHSVQTSRLVLLAQWLWNRTTGRG
jgi:hypothetical protein